MKGGVGSVFGGGGGEGGGGGVCRGRDLNEETLVADSGR